MKAEDRIAMRSAAVAAAGAIVARGGRLTLLTLAVEAGLPTGACDLKLLRDKVRSWRARGRFPWAMARRNAGGRKSVAAADEVAAAEASKEEAAYRKMIADGILAIRAEQVRGMIDGRDEVDNAPHGMPPKHGSAYATLERGAWDMSFVSGRAQDRASARSRGLKSRSCWIGNAKDRASRDSVA